MLVLLTTSVLKHREVPATVSSSYVAALYTAMLRTPIAAVVLDCFKFCLLNCVASVMFVDCAVVELSLIHISEPTRPERISYAVFCLKKK